jgi:CxxC motif-containing protein (DUF1111 family)
MLDVSNGVTRRWRRVVGASALLIFSGACADLLTEAPESADLFDAPVEGLSASELAAFSRGDAEFARRFSPATGLGPIFNDASCASCHSGDGRGRLENALQRIGSPDDNMLRAVGGPQIQTRAVPGAFAEQPPSGVPVSLRLPPPVFGMGLIEAIDDATILALADSADTNGDGISGRPNFVLPASYLPDAGSGATRRIGRFGRKAQVSGLIEQTVEAYHQDIGITSDFIVVENLNPLSSVHGAAVDVTPDPEVPASTVHAVVHYLRALAPPAPGADNALRSEGRALFSQVGCASCHVPSVRTGQSPIAALSNRQADLYSDLLLHDMGDALADNRPDGAANGREWRTTPLWGLRLMRRFLNGQAFLLHDGRARSVEEAITTHGGEASASRNAFMNLAPAQRAALLDFVESR